MKTRFALMFSLARSPLPCSPKALAEFTSAENASSSDFPGRAEGDHDLGRKMGFLKSLPETGMQGPT